MGKTVTWQGKGCAQAEWILVQPFGTDQGILGVLAQGNKSIDCDLLRDGGHVVEIIRAE
jgi:hypothetical protein